MLVDTLRRTQALQGGSPMVVCNEDHRFIVAEQLRNAGVDNGEIVLEPIGRNTAPAVAIAALQAIKSDPEAILLVLPADHIILQREAFVSAVQEALPLAEQGRLVTFGVVPSKPETGYGYIRRGDNLSGSGYAIDSFVEKPDLATAEGYLTSGDYLWE